VYKRQDRGEVVHLTQGSPPALLSIVAGDNREPRNRRGEPKAMRGRG